MWPLLLDPEARSWSSDRGLLLELDHKNCSYTAIRTTTFSYVRYREPVRRVTPPLQCPGDGAEELYDLRSDPHELTNLADDDAMRSVVARTALNRRLRELVTCSGHPGARAPNPCE